MPHSSLGKSEQTRAMRSRIPISSGERWAERKQYTAYVAYREAPTFLKLNKLLHLFQSIFAKNYRLICLIPVWRWSAQTCFMCQRILANHGLHVIVCKQKVFAWAEQRTTIQLHSCMYESDVGETGCIRVFKTISIHAHGREKREKVDSEVDGAI